MRSKHPLLTGHTRRESHFKFQISVSKLGERNNPQSNYIKQHMTASTAMNIESSGQSLLTSKKYTLFFHVYWYRARNKLYAKPQFCAQSSISTQQSGTISKYCNFVNFPYLSPAWGNNILFRSEGHPSPTSLLTKNRQGKLFSGISEWRKENITNT
jgi:hypothetical protein